jgi:uncharacterized protein with HEPN domain
MRNRVIHEYDRIDLAIVWQVAQVEIPKLLEWVKPFFPVVDNPSDGHESDE